MKIAIIGVGKIGYAILRGVKSLNVEVIGTGRSETTLEKIKKEGTEATNDNDYAVRKSDIVILAVKPQHFHSVLREVSKNAWDGKKSRFCNGWSEDFHLEKISKYQSL